MSCIATLRPHRAIIILLLSCLQAMMATMIYRYPCEMIPFPLWAGNSGSLTDPIWHTHTMLGVFVIVQDLAVTKWTVYAELFSFESSYHFNMIIVTWQGWMREPSQCNHANSLRIWFMYSAFGWEADTIQPQLWKEKPYTSHITMLLYKVQKLKCGVDWWNASRPPANTLGSEAARATANTCVCLVEWGKNRLCRRQHIQP